MNFNLAIELGSSYTTIYKDGLGIVLKEPSLIALEQKGKHKVVKCVGNQCKKLFGKTNLQTEIISPIIGGEIVNFQLAKLMLGEFLKRVDANGGWFKPRNKAIFLVQCGMTAKEKKNLKNLGYSLNLSQVSLVPCAIAGLIGMEIEPGDITSHCLVNFGGGTTDIAIVNGTTIIRGCTIDVGGTQIDRAIAKLIKEKYGVIISSLGAEFIKYEVASLLKNDTATVAFSGQDVDTNNRREVTVYSHDLYPIIYEYVHKIVITIESMLNMSSGEVVNDITKCGIYVCGGSSHLTGLERFLKEKLCLSVYIDDDPENTVMRGAGRLLSSPKLLTNIAQ